MSLDAYEQVRQLEEADFWPVVTDANGNRVQIRDFGTTWPKGKPAEGSWNGVLPGPGTYTIGFGKDGGGETRTIVVS